MKKLILPIVVTLVAAICYRAIQGAKSLCSKRTKERHGCGVRTDRFPLPSAEFILKVTPENSGSKHWCLAPRRFPPGGVIPKHKHLEQDEILLSRRAPRTLLWMIRNTTCVPGGTVFFPAETWVSLKNIGTDSISLGLYLLLPGFEKNMRCGSVLAGHTAPPINTRRTQGLRS